MANSLEFENKEQEQKQLPTPPPEPASSERSEPQPEATPASTEKTNTEDVVESQKQEPTPTSPSEENTEQDDGTDTSSDSCESSDEDSVSSDIWEGLFGSDFGGEKDSKKKRKKKDKKSKLETKAKGKSSEKPKPKKEEIKPSDKATKKTSKKAEKKAEGKKEKKDVLPKGMKAELKTLFAKGSKSCRCCTTWVEENPDETKSVDETDECRQHAIVVRKKMKHEGTRKPLKVDSIVVHSPLLKKALVTVFEGYPDLVIDVEELVFSAPFFPFFHRWDKFEEAKDKEQDEITKSHLVLLYDVLASELKSTIQRHRDLVRHKAIDFDILWTLFAPGTLMFSFENGHERLYKTGDSEYRSNVTGGKIFCITCEMVDWDGTKFGTVQMSEGIDSFKGSKKITSLSSYPLQFHANADEVLQKCIARGRKFHSLTGVHCKDFNGIAIEYARFARKTLETKRHVEGRIVLDTEMFDKFNPEEARAIRDLQDDETKVEKATKDGDKDAQPKNEEVTGNGKSQEPSDSLPDTKTSTEEEQPKSGSDGDLNKADATSAESKAEDGEVPTEGQSESKASVETESLPNKNTTEETTQETSEKDTTSAKDQDVAESTTSKKPELTETQLAICNSWLRGYALPQQKWASFSVDNIEDVKWNDDAFKELTLPDEYRELILATIQSQIQQNQVKQKQEQAEKEQKEFNSESNVDFDDFIVGKGRGYIMLFSGNPGVGKTATAESIAELLHVPLCMISVGNLGTMAETVESALQDVLEIAAKWNAVLLLDEADIFLEQRTKHELHRNAVVSVFLRLLEYYQGVLCMTTNRAEEIDEAFHSRIHISLPFPDLTENSRESIWRQFARLTDKRALKNPPKAEEGAAGVNLSAADFRKLAQYPLNGRQIKNAFKTAVLLASYKKERVGMKHVKTALKTIEAGGRGERLGMYT